MKMKDFNAKKQDLVSSRESMSTKGIGTTVDATAIPVSCKSINSNQNLPISNNNQQEIQTKINLSKKSRVWRWGEESAEEIGEGNVAEDGSNQNGTWK